MSIHWKQLTDFRAALVFTVTTMIRLLAGLIVIKFIAKSTGAEGMGLLGQFMSILAIASIFAGGGISTGLVKYVAETRNDRLKFRKYIQTGLAFTILSGIVFFVVLIMAARPTSRLLFSTEKFYVIILALSVLQFLIGVNNFSLAIINGHKDVFGYSISTIGGSLLGVIGMYLLTRGGHVTGAMFGLLWFSTATVLFSLPLLWIRHKAVREAFSPWFEKTATQNLFKFSGLQLVSAFAMPMAHILIRSMAGGKYGWAVVGYWQGVNKISDAYLQFFTVFLGNYFLPRLVEAQSLLVIREQVFRLLKVIFPTCLTLAVCIYICKKLIIKILFSPDFAPMAEYFTFQALGDVFKIAAYSLLYVAISRAYFRVYIMAEIFQCFLLVVLSWLGLKHFGPAGLMGAYAITYFVFFWLAILTFLYWLKTGIQNQRGTEEILL